MEESYSIRLPAFEGPLDLLLHLIRENKVDIYDIPIALITRQYLDYIEMMKELNLEVAGEFLVMAATLIHIKSRMLLPVEETADTLEEMDPRFELVQRLIEYQAFKDAALGLREKEEEHEGVFSRRSAAEDEGGEEEQEFLFDVNLFDLIGAFKKVLETAPLEVMEVTRATLTVKDRMSVIMETLQGAEALRFEDLFKGDFTRGHLVVTFVALLELLRLGLARAYQEREFGEIWVIRPEHNPQPQPEAEAEPAGTQTSEIPPAF
jgi:segregation and condensation protein A